MRISILIWVILFLFSYNEISAQAKIKVVSNGEPLPGVHIAIGESIHGFTDQNGIFKITNPLAKLVNFNLSHIGYSEVDTLVDCGRMNCDSIGFEMIPETIEIDEINITAPLSLFNNNRIRVRDISIHPEGLLAIYSKKGKRYLGLFTKSGVILHERRLKTTYHTIVKGLKEGYYNICTHGKCQEIFISHNRFIDMKKYKREFIEENLSSYILMEKNRFLRKEFSHHNQFFTIAEYDSGLNRKIQCKVFDQDGYTRATSIYSKIIGLYYSVMGTANDENLISRGILDNNIIKNGTWSGDVRDLNENNELNELINEYLHLHAKELSVDAYCQNGFIYLFDALNNQITIKKIDEKEKKIIPFSIDKDMEILLDDEPNLFYFLSSGSLYTLNATDHSIVKISDVFESGMNVKSQFVCDRKLITLIRKSNNSKDYQLKVMAIK